MAASRKFTSQTAANSRRKTRQAARTSTRSPPARGRVPAEEVRGRKQARPRERFASPHRYEPDQVPRVYSQPAGRRPAADTPSDTWGGFYPARPAAATELSLAGAAPASTMSVVSGPWSDGRRLTT